MKYFVERQKGTGEWHIDEVDRSLNANLDLLLKFGDVNGYVPIAMVDTVAEADQVIEYLNVFLNEKLKPLQGKEK